MTPPSGSAARGVRGAWGVGGARGLGSSWRPRSGSARGRRPRRWRRAPRRHGHRRIRRAATGRSGAGRRTRLQLPLRDRARRRHRRRPAAGLVLQQPRHGDRDAGGRRRRPSTSATGRATSTRSTTRPGSRAGRYQAPPHGQVYAGQIVSSAAVADVDGVGTVFFAAARRCTRCAPRTGRCAGSTSSAARATTTTRPRSSRRPSSSTAWSSSATTCTTASTASPAGVFALDAATGKERWQLDDRARPKATARPGRAAATCGARPPSTVERGARVRRHRQLQHVTRWVGPLQRGDLRPRPRHRRRALDVPAAPARTTTTSTSPARRTCSRSTGASSSGSATRTASTTRSTAPPASSCGRRRSTEPGHRGPELLDRRLHRRRPRTRDGVIVGGTAVGRLARACTRSTPPPVRSVAADGGGRRRTPSTAIANGVAFVGGTTDFTLPRPRPRDRRRAVVARDARRRRRRCRDRRRQRRRGRGHPRAGRRQPQPQQRRLPLRAERQAGHVEAREHCPAARRRRRRTRPRPSRTASAAPCDLDFGLTSDRLPGLDARPGRSRSRSTRSARVRGRRARRARRSGCGRAAPRQKDGAKRFARVHLAGQRQPHRRARLRARRGLRLRRQEAARSRTSSYNRVSILAVIATKEFPSLVDGFDRLVATNSFRSRSHPRQASDDASPRPLGAAAPRSSPRSPPRRSRSRSPDRERPRSRTQQKKSTERDRVQRRGQQPQRVRRRSRRSRSRRDPQPTRTTPTASTSTPRSASSPTDSNRVHRRRGHRPAQPAAGLGDLRADGHARSAKLSAKQIGKLMPTYQGSLDNAENYGCGFLPDGRILTTDVGNQASGRRRRPAHRVVPAVQHARR